MPHNGPLNPLSKKAFDHADAAVQEYLNLLAVLLINQRDTIFNYKVVLNEAEDLRYQWTLHTKERIDKDVQAIINALKAESLAKLAPLIKSVEKNKTLWPEELTLTAKFNITWDRDIWKAVALNRAEWHSLSESLWRITEQAQQNALDLIMKASMEGLTFGQVKDQFAELLTEKGKGNMDYNVRRLWANELRRDRIVAQQVVWKSMGFIEKIKLLRSPTADVDCDICGEAIGYNPNDEKIVSIDYNDLPPYHPWCQCFTLPVEPAPEQIKAFIDSQYNALPFEQFAKIGVLGALSSSVHYTTPEKPTVRQMAEMYQEARREDYLRTLDAWLKSLRDQFKKKYKWTNKEADEWYATVHRVIGQNIKG